MDIEKIEEIARREMEHRRYPDFREPGWILYHGQRTGKIAVSLAQKANSDVDCDVLYTAGLFHDIAKGRKSHNEIGAELVVQLLKNMVKSFELDEICNIIRNHNQRKCSDSFSDSVKLVQDADLIDHVGLIDVWMAFYWSGFHGENIHQHIGYITGDSYKNMNDSRRNHLNFEVSRKLFEDRIQLSEELFTRFRKTYFDGI